MFCPKCNAEYRPGFTECADCHVALVDTPSAQTPQVTETCILASAPARLLQQLTQWLELRTQNSTRWRLFLTNTKNAFVSRWFGVRVLGYSYLLVVVYSVVWSFASRGLNCEDKDALFRHSPFIVLGPLMGLVNNGCIVLYIIHIICLRHQGARFLVLRLLLISAYMVLIFITTIAICGIGD